MEYVFGASGVGARSAVGMGSLPFLTPVEIEVIVEVLPPFSPHPSSFTTAMGFSSTPPPFLSQLSGGGGFSFEDLGVSPLVNAMGTMTALGGSRMHPEAR